MAHDLREKRIGKTEFALYLAYGIGTWLGYAALETWNPQTFETPLIHFLYQTILYLTTYFVVIIAYLANTDRKDFLYRFISIQVPVSIITMAGAFVASACVLFLHLIRPGFIGTIDVTLVFFLDLLYLYLIRKYMLLISHKAS
jgi:hypothetical protein